MDKRSVKKYYISKRTKILSNYDKKITIFRKVLFQELGEPKSEIILKNVKAEYKKLIPEILLIESETNFLLREFKNISIALAFARVMKQSGFSKEEIAVLIYEIQKEMYKSATTGKLNLIRFVFNAFHSFPLNIIYKNIIKRYQKIAQKGKKKSNMQIHYVEGDGKNFDYGIDILSCPICDSWRKHEVIDILPYVCLYDFFKSLMTNSGLERTMTLSEGKEKCDNRFKQGRKPQNRQITQFVRKK